MRNRQVRMSDARLDEAIAKEDYFANGVSLASATHAKGWSAYRLTVNSGVSSLFREKKPHCEEFLRRSMLHAGVEGSVLTVYSNGTAFYHVDIANLLTEVTSEHEVEALVGYGTRQVIVVVTEKSFAGQRPFFFTSSVLNPDSEPACTATDTDRTFKVADQCQRPDGHAGDHQSLRAPQPKPSFAYATFSRGGAMRSWEQLFGIPTPCAKCGFILEGDGDVSRDSLCFGCSFWKTQKENERDNAFVIDGHHYRPGQGGFYGRKFKVRRHDGTLWQGELFTQGQIPAHLREEFPDNAVFVTDEAA